MLVDEDAEVLTGSERSELISRTQEFLVREREKKEDEFEEMRRVIREVQGAGATSPPTVVAASNVSGGRN